MQLRATRLTAIATAVRRVVAAFTPLALFSGGASGVWYDPSDYATLFQDSAGTTPVTAVEQPVGLMLDKSRGLVLGSDVAVNGDFATDTDWTKTTGWTISGGSANFSGSNDKQLTQTTLVSGKNYFYTVTATNVSGGKFCVWDSGTAAFKFFEGWTGTQTFTGIIRSGTNTLAIYASAGSFSIDNISVKELPGNHAFQATSASRPVLSARYNLLTKTEQFDDAVWSKLNSASVTANSTTAPDGTLTADTLTAAFTSSLARQAIAVSVGTTYVFSIYAKCASGTVSAMLRLEESSSPFPSTVQDITVTTEWQRFTVTRTITTSANVNCDVFPDVSTGNKSIFIWGADNRVSNNGITQPAYQRVNTATDYATTGFLPYLKFDGVDDSLSTNSISFTATDKMSVFAGVRKLGSSTGVIAELSANADTNPGVFSFANDATASNQWFSKVVASGVGGGYQATASPYASPISSVLASLLNISGATLADKATIRVNGVASSERAQVSAGTGNFSNNPLFIGRRGGTTLPFNGQLYSLIIVGKAVTAGELSSTETWVNGKTGAYA